MDNNDLEKALTAIGAVIEISWFIHEQMINQGYTAEEASSTAQKFILQNTAFNGNKDGES